MAGAGLPRIVSVALELGFIHFFELFVLCDCIAHSFYSYYHQSDLFAHPPTVPHAMYSHGNKGMVPRAVPKFSHYIIGLGYPKLKVMYLSFTQ